MKIARDSPVTRKVQKNKATKKKQNSPSRGKLRAKDSGRRLATRSSDFEIDQSRDSEFLRGPVFYSTGSLPKKHANKEDLSRNQKMQLIEELRRQQNEELLTVLNTEQDAESRRVRARASARTEKDCSRLDRQFARERVETSKRIMSLTARHENELEHRMKLLGVSSMLS